MVLSKTSCTTILIKHYDLIAVVLFRKLFPFPDMYEDKAYEDASHHSHTGHTPPRKGASNSTKRYSVSRLDAAHNDCGRMRTARAARGQSHCVQIGKVGELHRVMREDSFEIPQTLLKRELRDF